MYGFFRFYLGLISNKFNTTKPNIIEITIIPKTIAVLTVGLSGFGLPNLPILYELNSQIKRNASGNAIRPPNSPNSVGHFLRTVHTCFLWKRCMYMPIAAWTAFTASAPAMMKPNTFQMSDIKLLICTMILSHFS